MARSRGFTLIEVLVALAIFAVVLTAALRASSIATDTAYGFRERLLAGWVAENRIAGYSAGLWPELGDRAGITEQAGLTFGWRERVSQTENPRLRRIDVQIFAPEVPEYVLARLVGYATGTP
ncbi:MAG: type II secretion system minor pseudopilin GspI [Burkholderiales bacterium]